jgi:hypothetical protein
MAGSKSYEWQRERISLRQFIRLTPFGDDKAEVWVDISRIIALETDWTGAEGSPYHTKVCVEAQGGAITFIVKEEPRKILDGMNQKEEPDGERDVGGGGEQPGSLKRPDEEVDRL